MRAANRTGGINAGCDFRVTGPAVELYNRYHELVDFTALGSRFAANAVTPRGRTEGTSASSESTTESCFYRREARPDNSGDIYANQRRQARQTANESHRRRCEEIRRTTC